MQSHFMCSTKRALCLSRTWKSVLRLPGLFRTSFSRILNSSVEYRVDVGQFRRISSSLLVSVCDAVRRVGDFIGQSTRLPRYSYASPLSCITLCGNTSEGVCRSWV